MILILGGYAQGRLRYAMKNYSLTTRYGMLPAESHGRGRSSSTTQRNW